MVRTRGLRWALGRVLGRALGRQIVDDEKKAPQRQRPTTSTCRQQATVAVVEYVEHVDHVAGDVHEELQEPVTDHVGANTEDFPGGSHDTSVLALYANHVAARVWAREVVIYLIISYLNNYLSFYFN